MRRITRLAAAVSVVGVALAGAPLKAAPPAPTYRGVEQTIASIRDAWSKAGARVEPNAPGWNALFDVLLAELGSYSRADNDTDRLTALNRVYQISAALGTVPWAPAANLREEVRQWLRPRVRLAWAQRRIEETVAALPASSDPGIQANRSRWVEFVDNDLGRALRDYDAANTVAQRQTALRRIHQALQGLEQQNQHWQWPPSWELAAAVNDLFNRPNLDLTADVATVAPIFDANLVQSGPITRKGYVSYVTAGPKTGFGLLPSDDGIMFYNSQALSSVTPIWDFQNKLEQDRRGRRAAKMYSFGAESFDWSELTVTAILTPSGLNLIPNAGHLVDGEIWSAPQPGGGLGRAIAGLLGFNQQKITNLVYQNAVAQFRQQVPAEAAEETQERISAEVAQRNADLRSKYLIGNDTAAIRDFLITHLSLRSRPEAIFVGGLFQWRGAPDQRGADAPQPPRLASSFDPGVTADLHLGSLLTSAASGLWLRDPVKSVQNLMIVTKAVPPGTPPKDAVAVTRNVDFATYLKAVDQARNAHDPRVSALRVIRPAEPPEFSSDSRGFLVALVHDFQLDVPAPDPQAGGNFLGEPAKVLRIQVPLAEIALSYQLDTSSPGLRLRGKIEEFNPGTNATVLAITDDESKAKALTRFTMALVMTAVGTKIRSEHIDVSLDQLKLPGFAIHSLSPLDPSGWVRVNLVKTETGPARETEPAREVRPAPLTTPGGGGPVSPARDTSPAPATPGTGPSPTPEPSTTPPPVPGPPVAVRPS
ncbi:MAG TPA: hypothetical protein VFF52_22020 [Isosphaeraceae bacterium]|nr:hypothetical protein [Isosphaeraceae bacterium]